MIKIDTIGYILDGDDKDSYIKILDDKLCTGGYLILIASSQSMEDCFDDWVEDYDSLKVYFLESSWKIKWLGV